MHEDFYRLELECAEKGLYMAGADEAGRGPLAGPVVAAAVILPAESFIEGVDDSKKLTEKKRERLYQEIVSRAVCYGIGVAGVEEIERLNILNAARLAFQRAVGQLRQPFYLYADYITGLELSYTPVKHGDAEIYSIAAASILAKVTRDRLMQDYGALYPEYGFQQHKGYGTAAHFAALEQYGPCPIHRRSFLKWVLHE